MLARSYLFVPADRPERFGKALSCGADAVIVDLEDAVAPQAKEAARETLRHWLTTAQAGIVLRINGIDSPWFEADLTLCRHPRIAAVMLPKAERAQDLARLGRTTGDKPLLPLIETAAGFAAMGELTRIPEVHRLVFGSVDFQLDLGIQGDDDALLYFRSCIVLASKLAQLAAPVDGVSTAIDDVRVLKHDTARAHRMGFGAKLCIHPRQVDAVNRGFSPSATEVEWARRVLEAAEPSRGSATTVDGRMVDRPVILRAQAVLQALNRT